MTSGGVPAAAPVTIAGLGTALPAHRLEQAELLRALARVWPRLARRVGMLDDGAAGQVRFLVRSPDEFAVPLTPDQQRHRYLTEATALAERAGRQAMAAARVEPDRVGLLVVASCTGYVLPGVDVQVVNALGLCPGVRRVPLAHFGCAGGAAGLAHAADWSRAHPDEDALVIAVEVPSLTFRPFDTSPDNLLSALVFGDGAGAAVLRAGASPGLVCLGRGLSRLVPGTEDALGFELADDGFRVIVSRRLPEILAAHLPAAVAGLIDGDAQRLDAVALHPGGRAIVDGAACSLGLDERQLTATRATMAGTGNTSSAAILFVLAELAGALSGGAGRGLLAAFGPGLTIELLELSWAC